MRVFLSHSSNDKKTYVEYVSKNLSSDDIIIDEKSFIIGQLSNEEMKRLIDSCDLFVLFISKNSLDSKNVQFEIKYFKNSDFDKNKFIPIIIDENILYSDSRIPDWMRDYNLKRVSSPKKAVAIIDEQIRILTWEKYDLLRKKDAIFKGRNEYIEKFETRYHDRSNGKAICYCASGFEAIGRTSFLNFCLKKVGKIRQSYTFQSFTLGSSDSIEDFIFKLNELGVSPPCDIKNLFETPLEQKISIAASLLNNFLENDEVVHIYDNGCIITNKGIISDWFISILNEVSSNNNGTKLAISAKYRCLSVQTNKFWSISIPELSPLERSWLLESYLHLYNIVLTDDEFNICLNWLQGYPQQVFLLVQYLANNGFEITKENSYDIVKFNMNKADSILAIYKEDVKKMIFLATIAKFELIKISDLLYAFNNDKFYQDFISELLIFSICVHDGVSKEYVRMNDTIREYINRKRYNIDSTCFERLKEKIIMDFENDAHGIPESSELYFYITHAIDSNKDMPNDYVFPSHFAKCMQDIYHQRKDDSQVIRIADFLISKKQFIASNIIKIAYYYLCLALARTKNSRVLMELYHLENADKHFIKGFYYRKIFKWIDAIHEFMQALAYNQNHKRTKRELVIAYTRLSEYEKAFSLAKELYEEDPSNIHFAHAYFKCLLHEYLVKKDSSLGVTIQKILESTTIGDDVRDQSMYISMQAEFIFYIRHDVNLAYTILKDFLSSNPNDIQTMIVLFNIAEKTGNISLMEEYNSLIKKMVVHYAEFEDTLTRNKILITTYRSTHDALNDVDNLPSSFSDNFKIKLKEDIKRISQFLA